ncbi:MAG: type I-E CRISPR-associated protein Cas6/Cse3/CasE [Nocardioides sp.]|jgi:CRISPR system Cascade subunit CasE
MTLQPSTAAKTGIFWTQFPAVSLTGSDGKPVDWSDHKAAHRAVSRMFPPKLPGAPGRRRAESGILYRVDALGPAGEPTVLVQSQVLPELTPVSHRTTEVSRRAWVVESGARVAFRLAVNPVSRTTRYFTDADKKSPADWSNQSGAAVPRGDGGRRVRAHAKRTERVVPVDQMGVWLADKLAGALGEVEIVNHFRDRSMSGLHLVVVDTFDGLATVEDPEALQRLRMVGVGRAKSYGCGLLTLVRVGER